ncbi:hypothetical protein [Kitasatospora sp. NPDC057198]|uniref:zinc finger domain-containing protein n=1 Tax=Kitasatospora sp. NPDC057198 TaxID=3346046 RepID=UPI003628AC1E
MSGTAGIDALAVRCPRCRAAPGTMCDGRDQVHPIRAGAARAAGPGPAFPSERGPARIHGGAPWEEGWDRAEPDWHDLYANPLGPYDAQMRCCLLLRDDEFGCPVCDRDCWLCNARQGTACRPHPATPILQQLAHRPRSWRLGFADVLAYRQAMERSCPRCKAEPGTLCTTAGTGPRKPRRSPHTAR